jgi:Ca-activated chloride channel family protein
VLITDGVNNAGEIDPLSAAAACAGLGIKVYTIGVGSERSVVPVPITRQDPLTGRTVVQRTLMRVPMDERLLREIAKRTGGQFFRATDPEALRRVFAEIDRLEKTPLKVQRYVRYREAFPPLAWTGLGLLLLPLAAAGIRVTAEP